MSHYLIDKEQLKGECGEVWEEPIWGALESGADRSNEKVTSGIVAINAWKAHFKKFR